jgi:hypothetical protein
MSNGGVIIYTSVSQLVVRVPLGALGGQKQSYEVLVYNERLK